ncbi:unnamed protein product [Leuciscus chuanchicus]
MSRDVTTQKEFTLVVKPSFFMETTAPRGGYGKSYSGEARLILRGLARADRMYVDDDRGSCSLAVNAPKISPSSSCNGTDVTVCFCEVDGNPSPELEWHLSGRPASNSSNTFISEERLNSTGLRSSITLHQSLSHTSTLQCVDLQVCVSSLD